MSNFLP